MKPPIRLTATLVLVTVAVVVAAPSNEDRGGLPDWLEEHMLFSTRDGGRHVTDNSAYQSAGEPADQYAVEWSYGLGKKSMKGRLFGLRDGEEIGTYWEIRLFWHPGRREAVLHQYGGDGRVAVGTVSEADDGGLRALMDITAPDGTVTSVRDDHSPADGDTHTTASFVRQGDEWRARRSYTWSRDVK